jgi:hypothetical protein
MSPFSVLSGSGEVVVEFVGVWTGPIRDCSSLSGRIWYRGVVGIKIISFGVELSKVFNGVHTFWYKYQTTYAHIKILTSTSIPTS